VHIGHNRAYSTEQSPQSSALIIQTIIIAQIFSTGARGNYIKGILGFLKDNGKPASRILTCRNVVMYTTVSCYNHLQVVDDTKFQSGFAELD